MYIERFLKVYIYIYFFFIIMLRMLQMRISRHGRSNAYMCFLLRLLFDNRSRRVGLCRYIFINIFRRLNCVVPCSSRFGKFVFEERRSEGLSDINIRVTIGRALVLIPDGRRRLFSLRSKKSTILKCYC